MWNQATPTNPVAEKDNAIALLYLHNHQHRSSPKRFHEKAIIQRQLPPKPRGRVLNGILIKDIKEQKRFYSHNIEAKCDSFLLPSVVIIIWPPFPRFHSLDRQGVMVGIPALSLKTLARAPYHRIPLLHDVDPTTQR